MSSKQGKNISIDTDRNQLMQVISVGTKGDNIVADEKNQYQHRSQSMQVKLALIKWEKKRFKLKWKGVCKKAKMQMCSKQCKKYLQSYRRKPFDASDLSWKEGCQHCPGWEKSISAEITINASRLIWVGYMIADCRDQYCCKNVHWELDWNQLMQVISLRRVTLSLMRKINISIDHNANARRTCCPNIK